MTAGYRFDGAGISREQAKNICRERTNQSGIVDLEYFSGIQPLINKCSPNKAIPVKKTRLNSAALMHFRSH